MIELVAAGTVYEQGSGIDTMQPGVPFGAEDWDLILLVAGQSVPEEFSGVTPSGWTELTNWTADVLGLGIWYRFMRNGSYGGTPTITMPPFTNRTALAQALVFRGVDYRNPIGPIIEPPDSDINFNDDQFDIGPLTGLTPDEPGSAIIAVGLRGDGTSSGIATLTGDVDWEEITDRPEAGQGVLQLTLVMDYAIDDAETPTTVTDKTFDVTGGTHANWMGQMFCLNPIIEPERRQGWPRVLSDPPADGQGWPRR